MSTEAKTGLMALGAALVIFCGVGGLLAVLSLSGSPEKRPGKSPAAAKASQPSDSGPYPECPTILRWLKENTGDPASVQIIEWQGRVKGNPDAPLPSAWTVHVKYRGRNQYGGAQVETRWFAFSADGKIVGTAAK